MSWESRNGKGRYYSRSRRVNGRIVREYWGSGNEAELRAKMDSMERAKQDAAAIRWANEKAKHDTLAVLVDEVFRLVELLARDVLLASGCHQHKGTWRRRRGNQRPKTSE